MDRLSLQEVQQIARIVDKQGLVPVGSQMSVQAVADALRIAPWQVERLLSDIRNNGLTDTTERRRILMVGGAVLATTLMLIVVGMFAARDARQPIVTTPATTGFAPVANYSAPPQAFIPAPSPSISSSPTMTAQATPVPPPLPEVRYSAAAMDGKTTASDIRNAIMRARQASVQSQ